MPASCRYGCGVEKRTAIRHGWSHAAISRENLRHKLGNLAHAGGRQFPCVSAQFARLIAVDQLQRERDVTAILGEAGSLGRVPHLQLSVAATFRHYRQVTHRADQRASNIMQAVEMFLHGDVFPPVIAGSAKVFPSVSHQLVQRVLNQTAKISGGSQLCPLRIVTAMQLVVAGEREV